MGPCFFLLNTFLVYIVAFLKLFYRIVLVGLHILILNLINIFEIFKLLNIHQNIENKKDIYYFILFI